jgi:hypothetical protein
MLTADVLNVVTANVVAPLKTAKTLFCQKKNFFHAQTLQSILTLCLNKLACLASADISSLMSYLCYVPFCQMGRKGCLRGLEQHCQAIKII